MADVQLDKGYIRIANALYDAVHTARFTDAQRRIVLALVRLTYGWGRKTVEISVPELAKLLDVANSGGFRGGLTELTDAGVVQMLRAGTGRKRSVFAVQKDHEQWGRYSVATACLAAKWGARPTHCDALLAASQEADEIDRDDDVDDAEPPPIDPVVAPQSEGSNEGASAKAPSLLSGQGALAEASITQDAFLEASLNEDSLTEAPWVPAPRREPCLPAGTLDSSKSLFDETLQSRKDRKDSSTTTTTTTTRAEQEPAIDPTTLLRWDELAKALSTDHNVGNVVAFLTRLKPGERHGWSARLCNWLSGLDCPPSYTPTADVLSTALSEYAGDCAPRHVWSFVEDAVRRFERAKGNPIHMRLPGVSGRNAGAPDPAVRRRAAEIWAVVKREGLATCNPNLIAGRVQDLATRGELPPDVADATAFLELFQLFPRSTLSAARNDHFAEQAILEVLTTHAAA